ncbi:MAG TPA: 2-oxoglutarate and iron-dependent oxygenase domain-containing protein [Candidatus Binataceae bacterium]|nr:2-oxoglutarate and iron-dependent oxygenase domain-containing protein [Candidatus Binataceae bacterium]
MALLSVPIVDIAPFFAENIDGKHKVAAAVNQACEDIGFFVITGHGVDTRLADRVFAESRGFFDLPLAEKQMVSRPAPEIGRGYSAPGTESSAYSRLDRTPPDIKESFTIGLVDVPQNDSYYHCPAAGHHFAPNLWPQQPAGLSAAYADYYRAMERLSVVVMRIFALALGLEEDYFGWKCDKPFSVMRVLHYFDQVAEPMPGQLRCSEHTDYSTMTLLRHDREYGADGLQVQNRAGTWVDVPAIPDSFVINLGDMMMRWTNDRWVSTPHRVLNPPPVKTTDSRRLSIAFFHESNYDATIECLPNCSTVERPPQYPPISCGDYVRERLRRQGTFKDLAGNAAA